jgi:transcriptional regulator with XRE-family HTH domain
MKMSSDREWLRKRAEQEDRYFISVGGLAARLEGDPAKAQMAELTRTAFVRLLQLARREKRLTIQSFAAKADIDVAELLLIENDLKHVTNPRTVYRLAEFISVPAKRLMALAGLLQENDAEFEEATLQFAANSESVEELSKEEKKTLVEYVKFLSER